jgi:hypothetical protein
MQTIFIGARVKRSIASHCNAKIAPGCNETASHPARPVVAINLSSARPVSTFVRLIRSMTACPVQAEMCDC